MIGLDTNVLVRYLVLDDPEQAVRALDIIDRRLTRDAPGFVSSVTLAELVWVLLRNYSWNRAMIGVVLEQLLKIDQLVLEHADLVADAMLAVRDQNADFADVLIGAIAREAGCSTTLTFDRRAQRLPGFSAA